MMHRTTAALLLLTLLLLSACGQKGPLYMEGHEPPGMKTAKQPVRKAPAEPTPQLEPSAPN